MLVWSRILRLFSPQTWLDLFYSYPTNGSDSLYYVGRDLCLKCNRYQSWHSSKTELCSFHNVNWNGLQERTTPYQLFKGSFEMWLRSRCGGDLNEENIATALLVLSSYLDYALTHAQPDTGNMYDFCDQVFCDYNMVYEFLMDMRAQAKVNTNEDIVTDDERHTINTELNICDGLHLFIEFRKFQLPVKGIVENIYAATERMLETYKVMLLQGKCDQVLISESLYLNDVDMAIHTFLPQFHIILNYYKELDPRRSMENGCDLNFATSFLALYLYRQMPDNIDYIHMVRVRDILPELNHSVTYSSDKSLNTELSRYVCSADLPSPTIASACISKIQKLMLMDPSVCDVVMSYITHIKPRISKSNDYLLLDSSGLGLSVKDVHERVVTLLYRVTGKVTSLVSSLDVPITPRALKTSTPTGRRARKGRLTQKPKQVRFGQKITKKYKKLNKKKTRRQLIIDLSPIESI